MRDADPPSLHGDALVEAATTALGGAALRRLLRALLLAAGLAVIGYLVYAIGAATLWHALETLSWRFLVILCFPYPLVATLDTVAWRFAFPREPAPFAWLLWTRLAGEAVNVTTPTASVGGEPVKAYLLSSRVPMAEGLASVIVDKTTITLGQAVFLAVGLLIGVSTLALPGAVATSMGALLALEIVAAGGFVLAQTRGLFGGSGRILRRLGLASTDRYQAKLGDLDRWLERVYRGRRGRLCWSVLFHLLAWGAGSLEIYLVLSFLGVPVSPVTALVVESFGTAIKFASFMIPASLGALEGGNVAIFAALGLGGAAGLSYTVIRRLREAVWATAGLALLILLTPRAGTTPTAGRAA